VADYVISDECVKSSGELGVQEGRDNIMRDVQAFD
jgi:hypothetical protein